MLEEFLKTPRLHLVYKFLVRGEGELREYTEILEDKHGSPSNKDTLTHKP